MNRGTVVAALVASLLLMTWLFVASYAATGEGRVAGIGRIAVVALLGYLVLQGRRWASFLLALWFGLTAFLLLVVAVGVGGVGRILVSLGFAAVFAVAAVIMWKARTRGVAPHDDDVPGAPAGG